MAALAASAVTQLSGWDMPVMGGPTRIRVAQFSLVLASMGTIANPINASVLGFRKILWCSNAVKSDNLVVALASPSADGTVVILNNLAASTDADRDNPADLTGTFALTVHGLR